MIVWLASLFVVGGVGLAGWTLRPAKPAHVATVDGEALPTSRSLDLERTVSERVVVPALSKLSATFGRFTPAGFLDTTAKTLKVADLDSKWSPEMIVGIQVVGFFVGSFFGLFYVQQSGLSRNSILVAGLLIMILTFGPNAKINRMADDRRKAIQNELPDVLDQLTVTVEAGMSFDGALLRAGQEGRGLLAKELTRAVHDMQLGLTRGEALMALVERTDVSDLRGFVTAVRQAEKHGFPLANILRLQSQELRDRRRARAEEKAMQVPVKITFPLVFCILPALFIVILGPAILQITAGFAG